MLLIEDGTFPFCQHYDTDLEHNACNRGQSKEFVQSKHQCRCRYNIMKTYTCQPFHLHRDVQVFSDTSAPQVKDSDDMIPNKESI